MDAEKVFLADLDPSVSLVGDKIVEGVVSVYQVVSSEQTTSALAADLSSVSSNDQAMQIHILSIRTWEEVKRSQDVVPELFADFLEALVLATAGRACFFWGASMFQSYPCAACHEAMLSFYGLSSTWEKNENVFYVR